MSGSRHVSDGLRQAAAKAPEKSNFLQTCNLLSRYMKEKGSLRDLNIEIGGKVESLDAIVKPGSSLSASAAATTNSNLQTNPGISGKQISSPEQQSSMESSRRVSRPDSPSTIVVEDASNKTTTSKEGTTTTTEVKRSQLTIFYSGRVLVFDDYPADKARELVSIAKKSSSPLSYGILPNATPEKSSPASREGLPPRPHSGSAKQPVLSSSSAREGLPPRPQPPGGKQPVVISPDGCKEKAKPPGAGTPAAASNSIAVQKQASPAQSEATGSDLPIARRSSIHRFLEKRKDRTAARGPYQNHDHGAAGSSSKGGEQLDLNL